MIPYDLTKIKTIVFDVDGVLSANTIPMDCTGQPLRTVNIKDGYAIHLATHLGLRIVILTGGKTENVRLRYESLGLNPADIFLGASRKIEVYDEFARANGLKDDEVMYVGDDIPDYEVMARIGCPCCPADAATEIKDISIYVSPYDGGHGCGRDVIEQVLRAKKLWFNSADAFGW